MKTTHIVIGSVAAIGIIAAIVYAKNKAKKAPLSAMPISEPQKDAAVTILEEKLKSIAASVSQGSLPAIAIDKLNQAVASGDLSKAPVSIASDARPLPAYTKIDPAQIEAERRAQEKLAIINQQLALDQAKAQATQTAIVVKDASTILTTPVKTTSTIGYREPVKAVVVDYSTTTAAVKQPRYAGLNGRIIR
jgi:hypothetical protein